VTLTCVTCLKQLGCCCTSSTYTQYYEMPPFMPCPSTVYILSLSQSTRKFLLNISYVCTTSNASSLRKRQVVLFLLIFLVLHLLFPIVLPSLLSIKKSKHFFNEIDRNGKYVYSRERERERVQSTFQLL